VSRRLAVAAFVLLLPYSLDAQRSDSTMIPIDLALALITYGESSASRPTIVVGKLPADYLSPLVPRGATVLGGINYPSQRRPQTQPMMGRGVVALAVTEPDGRSTTILSMNETPDSAFSVVRAQIERAGWRPAPRPEWQGQGFIPTSRARMREGYYCSDSAGVQISAAPSSNTGSIVRLTAHRSIRNTLCDPEQQQRFSRGMREIEPRLPTLTPPQGAHVKGSGSSGGGDSREANAEIESPLSPAEMVSHFAAQLQQAGWTLGSRASEGDVSVQTARRTDERGRQLYGLLLDARFGPRDHQMSFRVWPASVQ
jgi:hypothetical protein